MIVENSWQDRKGFEEKSMAITIAQDEIMNYGMWQQFICFWKSETFFFWITYEDATSLEPSEKLETQGPRGGNMK